VSGAIDPLIRAKKQDDIDKVVKKIIELIKQLHKQRKLIEKAKALETGQEK